jgi:TPR repeat protein
LNINPDQKFLMWLLSAAIAALLFIILFWKRFQEQQQQQRQQQQQKKAEALLQKQQQQQSRQERIEQQQKKANVLLQKQQKQQQKQQKQQSRQERIEQQQKEAEALLQKQQQQKQQERIVQQERIEQQQKEQQQAVTVMMNDSICKNPRITLFHLTCLLNHKEKMRRFLFRGHENRLAELLSQRVGTYGNPRYYSRDGSMMMEKIKHRVTSVRLRTVRNKAAKKAKQLCDDGKCANAFVLLECAIKLGHLSSHAHKAWLLNDGRKGVAQDHNGALKLAEEGTRLGCHDCEGVLAFCYKYGVGCEQDEVRSLELARKSSGEGSMYGQYFLGELHYYGGSDEVAHDHAQALALHRLAAAQGLADAKDRLGHMYFRGNSVARDCAEALRWWRQAAAQGHPKAIYSVALCYEYGHSVQKSRLEAIRWYGLALEAGYSRAADDLRRLGA